MQKIPYEVIIDDANPEAIKLLLQTGLRDVNYQFFGNYELNRFAIYTKNDKQEVIGGLYGFILEKHHTMRIEYFWVQDIYRNTGMGTHLIQQLEQYAVKHHCTCIQLSTMEFHGSYFYQKRGYRLIGRIPKWFCERDELFFIKELPAR